MTVLGKLAGAFGFSRAGEGKPASLRPDKESAARLSHPQLSASADAGDAPFQDLDPELAQTLRGVLDPEIGLNIIDLGLVYRAHRTPDRVEIAMTLTSRRCPMGGLIVEEVRSLVSQLCTPDTAVDVNLVWDPPWNSDRITEAGRLALGGRP